MPLLVRGHPEILFLCIPRTPQRKSVCPAGVPQFVFLCMPPRRAADGAERGESIPFLDCKSIFIFRGSQTLGREEVSFSRNF